MKKLGLKLLGSLAVIIILLQTATVFATDTKELSNEKEQNQEEIDKAKKEKQEVEQEKNQTMSEVEKITTQISDYESEIQQLESKITELNTKIAESEEKIKTAQEEYNKNKKLFDERLVATYEAGDTSYLDVILSSQSFTDAISNIYLVTEIADYDTEVMEKIQKQQKEIEEAKKTLEESKKELDTSKASKQSVSTQLQTAKTEKNKKVEQLSEDEKKLQARIEELNQANKSIDSKIRAAQAAIEAAKKQNSNKNNGSNGNGNNNNSNSGGSSTGGGSVSNSGFIYPVPSGYSKITTGMYYASGGYHGAVDFGSGGINGQPIYAVADGYVVTSERLNGSYGNYILIAHYNGLYTLYAHGQDGSRTVSAGQTVTRGQQIMRVGNTGNSTGPHLHFEVRTSPGLYSNRVNPANYLP